MSASRYVRSRMASEVLKHTRNESLGDHRRLKLAAVKHDNVLSERSRTIGSECTDSCQLWISCAASYIAFTRSSRTCPSGASSYPVRARTNNALPMARSSASMRRPIVGALTPALSAAPASPPCSATCRNKRRSSQFSSFISETCLSLVRLHLQAATNHILARQHGGETRCYCNGRLYIES